MVALFNSTIVGLPLLGVSLLKTVECAAVVASSKRVGGYISYKYSAKLLTYI